MLSSLMLNSRNNPQRHMIGMLEMVMSLSGNCLIFPHLITRRSMLIDSLIWLHIFKHFLFSHWLWLNHWSPILWARCDFYSDQECDNYVPKIRVYWIMLTKILGRAANKLNISCIILAMGFPLSLISNHIGIPIYKLNWPLFNCFHLFPSIYTYTIS